MTIYDLAMIIPALVLLYAIFASTLIFGDFFHPPTTMVRVKAIIATIMVAVFFWGLSHHKQIERIKQTLEESQ